MVPVGLDVDNVSEGLNDCETLGLAVPEVGRSVENVGDETGLWAGGV